MLESCVLAVLSAGPAYGYEIGRRFEAAGFARPKGGTLYPILARLERDGLVDPVWTEGEGGPGRKYYVLTPDGQEAADAVRSTWDSHARRIAQLLVGPPEEVAT